VRRRSFVIAALVVAAALAAGSGCGRGAGGRRAGASADPKKVLIIGIDGLDWERANRLIGDGKMPNLERLMKEGASGIHHSIFPYLSPSVWTTMATGKLPEKHGIVGFLAEGGETGGGKSFAQSSGIRTMTLWQMLSAAEHTVGVVDWMLTYPAYPVNGYMASSKSVIYLSLTPEDGMTPEKADELREGVYPPEIWDEIAGLGVHVPEIPDEEVDSYLGTTDYLDDQAARPLLRGVAQWLAADKTCLNVASRLAVDHPTDLTAVYFRSNDIIDHLFWRYMEPETWKRGRPSDELVATFGTVIDRYYEEDDRIIGRLLELRDDGTVVIVCSDHGFAGHKGYPGFQGDVAMGPEMHREQGVLVITGPGIVPGSTIEDGTPLDITPTVLALFGLPIGRDMDGKPLTSVMEPSFLDRHPVTYVDTYDVGRTSGPSATEDQGESEIDQDTREMLKSLGYLK
jgi:predicted AlkP superfamily phosphohydrolase/phosphomutase